MLLGLEPMLSELKGGDLPTELQHPLPRVHRAACAMLAFIAACWYEQWGPPTHDLKAGAHHLCTREAHGTTWSSLGSRLVKLTFRRPIRGALRNGRGTVTG